MRWMLLILLSASVIQAAEPPTTNTADSTVQLTQSDPRSAIETQRKAGRIIVEAGVHYELKDESFQLHVPAAYDGSKPFGLLVWISAGGRGGLPQGLSELCDKHELIYVAANNSGNDRPIPIRLGLALDAAFNLQAQYNIDVSRIYASGISGGAKMASILGVLYPDTFCGSVPIVGVVYYRPIELENDPTQLWAPTFYPPIAPLLERAKAMNRFVLITGSNDMNRDSINGTYKRGFVLDRFLHVDYVEVPGMGHQMPPSEKLDAAFTKLDEPLPGLMGKTLQLAQQAQRTRHIDQARRLYESVLLHGEKKLAAQAATQLATLAPTTRAR